MRRRVVLVLASVGVAAYAVRPRRARRSFVDAVDPGRRHLLEGAVLHRYLAEGGPAGALGSPVSGVRRATADPATPFGADREVAFVHGTVYLDSAAARTKVLLRPG